MTSIRSGHDVSDSFSSDDWQLRRKEIFFLTNSSGPKSIYAATLVERMHGTGGTGKPKYRLTEPVSFSKTVPLQWIFARLPQLKDFISSPAEGKRIEHGDWLSLVQLVKVYSPDQASALDALLQLFERDAQLLGGDNKVDRLAEQRDAVGLAIDLAGISRGARLKSIDAKKAESANSILDLMDSLVIHERTLVDHDAPLLEKFLGPQFKGAEVESDLYRKVRVYVSDKTPLESALGVDLIIYQSLYHSFLLIQYKVMEYVKDADKHGWRYKTDAQLEMQLAQIDHVRSRLPTDTGASDMWGFRLNTDPYYFKFCERRKPSSRDDSLVAGMSMSAVHVKDFLANGASLVGYHNCPRYFNNTEFLSVARAGWIGTRDGATGFIEEIIRANQEGGRAAMLAIIDIPRGRTSELRKKKN